MMCMVDLYRGCSLVSDGERSGIDMEVLEDRVVATDAVVASSNDGGVQDCRPKRKNKQKT